MNKKGFTLVEIIIVLTILSILGTLAFFSYGSFTKSSRDAVRLSHLKEIQGALEIYAVQTKQYPVPENKNTGNIELNGELFEYSHVGYIQENISNSLKMNKVPVDPIFETNIKYATTQNNKKYQLASLLENQTGYNSPFGNQLYAQSPIPKLSGNYNARFIKVFTGGLNYVVSLPSLFIENGSSELDIAVDQEIQNIIINGSNATQNTYTPKVIYTSPKCGVETDQEIVDFLVNLKNAYDFNIFHSHPDYDDIFSDFESIGAGSQNLQDLKMNINEIDFSVLENIGRKINDALGCDIKQFKTTDIFPESCLNAGILEDGTIEGYTHNFDMRNSCLFSVTGSGTAETRNSIGKDGGKGIFIKPSSNTISLTYTAFSYVPAKLSFDYKGFINNTNYSGVSFYINGVLYENWKKDTLSTSYQKYSTELLPPGLNVFEIRIPYNNSHTSDYFHIDNILFGCKRMGELSGETNCGWTEKFENGNIAPWELFTFTGSIKTPWSRTNTNVTQGVYALKMPKLTGTQNTHLILEKNFSQPQRISFDAKISLSQFTSVRFFINNIEYKIFRHTDSSNDIFTPYTSPLLPAGDYTFRWEARMSSSSAQFVEFTLDNIRFDCIGGGSGCGVLAQANGQTSFESGDTPLFDIFTFTGAVQTPWNIVSDANDGSQALKMPALAGYQVAQLELAQTFSQPQRISFDAKVNASASTNVRFFINNIEYKIFRHSDGTNNIFTPYVSPLLPAGNYTFRWEARMSGNSGQFIELTLDDIRFDCIGGGSGCGVLAQANGQTSFESGDTPLSDIFTFTGIIQTPWNIVTDANDGSQALKMPALAGTQTSQPARLEYSQTFSQPQRISFDAKVNASSNTNVRFFINNIEYKIFRHSDGTNNSFTSYNSPLLPAGNYTFRWEAKMSSLSAQFLEFTLDNIRFDCINGGSGCGGILAQANGQTSFEAGDTALFDAFTFTGMIHTPWNIVTDANDGSQALKMPALAGTQTSQPARLEYSQTFSQPQRISFDTKVHVTQYTNVRFFINDVEYKIFRHTDSTNNTYTPYVSPLLPAGNYTFRWDAKMSGMSFSILEFTLDNIQFTD